MNLKRFVASVVLALAMSVGVVANADSVFYSEQGTLVLSNLKVDGQVYYVVLKLLPGTLDFRVDETSIEDLTLSAGNGSPGSPNLIDFNGSNTLFGDVFFNYYHVSAVSGQKLIVSTVLNQPLSTQQKTRCASSPGDGVNPSGYDTQIHMYNSLLERVGGICGENLTYEFPATGTYILHFSYGAGQSAGYFNAAIL